MKEPGRFEYIYGVFIGILIVAAHAYFFLRTGGMRVGFGVEAALFFMAYPAIPYVKKLILRQKQEPDPKQIAEPVHRALFGDQNTLPNELQLAVNVRDEVMHLINASWMNSTFKGDYGSLIYEIRRNTRVMDSFERLDKHLKALTEKPVLTPRPFTEEEIKQIRNERRIQ